MAYHLENDNQTTPCHCDVKLQKMCQTLEFLEKNKEWVLFRLSTYISYSPDQLIHKQILNKSKSASRVFRMFLHKTFEQLSV
jgi:hypothetical protein